MIAGLAMLGLMLQACLVAVQLSILVAPQAGAADSALNVICSDHGAVVLIADDGAPGDRQSDCAFCPMCWHGGAGHFAVLPGTAIGAVLAPARALAFDFDYDLQVVRFLAHPRGRGPPASA
jgi:hypothetical protein